MFQLLPSNFSDFLTGFIFTPERLYVINIKKNEHCGDYSVAFCTAPGDYGS